MTFAEAAHDLYNHLTNNGRYFPKWLQCVARCDSEEMVIVMCNVQPPPGAVPGIWPAEPDGYSVLYQVVGPLAPLGGPT